MNIVDLFSGAGGLTFGFCYKIRGNRFVRNRENNILFANEYDNQTALAFQANFNYIPLTAFDKSIFYAVVDSFIIGATDDDGIADPRSITFVYRAGVKGAEGMVSH